jgi:hypothetical protein
MKHKTLFFSVLMIFAIVSMEAQKSVKVGSTKYRRSSIYTIMIDDAGLVKADTIKASFLSAPVPDKYNDHNLAIKTFNPREIKLTDAERTSKGNNGGSKFGKSLLNDATGGLADTTDIKDLPIIMDKFLKENHIARDMIAKWFHRSEKGGFDMSLIGERGSWDATEMAANIAKKTTRGVASLADAGEELIGNTFVVITRFKYVNKEEIANATKGYLSVVAAVGGENARKIAAVAAVGATVAAKGYVVQTTSYLYKLSWNDSIAAVFYNDMWMDDNSIDPKKKAAFDTTNLFSLELIGTEKAWADVQSSIFTKKSDYELVRIATVRAVDAVIAKLQKKYDVFKTKTPILTPNPLTAKIGLKESLEKGDKFEILEQEIDEKTGKTKYVRKGVVKVDGSQIWDNRYMAGELQTADTTAAAAAKPVFDRTLFKGGSDDYYEGMLLRQIK